MKQCPLCEATFDDKVDFCFEDGTPLRPMKPADDPTALPSPTKGIPLAAAVTEIKPRKQRRGMFGRPSVADMLDVTGPRKGAASPKKPDSPKRAAVEAPQATPTGQPAPAAAPPTAPAAVPSPAPASASASPSLQDQPTVVEKLEQAATVIEEPPERPPLPPRAASPSLLDQETVLEDTIIEEPADPSDLPTPVAITVPPSPLAVDVPEAELPNESTDAPPGFEVPEPAAALDDSWFGDESFGSEMVDDGAQFDSPTVVDEEDTQPIPKTPAAAEDLGFDDALGLPGFDDADVGAPADDDIGFADDDMWGDISTTQSQPIPKGMVLGGVGILVAAVGLTVVLSGGDESSLPPAPQTEAVAVEAPPPVPAAQEPPPVDEAIAEGEAEDTTVEGAENPDDASVDDSPAVEPEADAPANRPAATPPATSTGRSASAPPPPVRASKAAKASKAQTAKAAKAAKSAKASRSAAKRDPVSVWTGAPASSGAAAAPAAAANPWGAPTDTPSVGRLTISTDPPQAMVYVNGRRIGRSPTETEVPFGVHEVRVEKNDYKSNSRKVSVKSAKVSVPFRLDPAVVSGKCNLLGSTGAVVTMNGKAVGSLPLTVSCAPGNHTFKVTPKEGAAFTTSRAVAFTTAGETATIFLSP